MSHTLDIKQRIFATPPGYSIKDGNGNDVYTKALNLFNRQKEEIAKSVKVKSGEQSSKC